MYLSRPRNHPSSKILLHHVEDLRLGEANSVERIKQFLTLVGSVCDEEEKMPKGAT